MLDLNISQSKWLRAFWPIFQEQNFSQTEDLYRNTVNNIYFHCKINSGKINDQIFLYIKKTYFWPTSPIFGGKKMFSQKIWHAQLDKVF